MLLSHGGRTFLAGLLTLAGLTAPVSSNDASQLPFSRAALAERVPEVRHVTYVVNGRVRPLLVFWVGREDIGRALVSWRTGPGERRAFEFLIGSDPERAPRHLNRWGFIVEEIGRDHADVLGVMRESNEQSLSEAEAQVTRQSDTNAFKAVRTVVTGQEALTGTMTVQAPSRLTYRDLDALLPLVASAPVIERRVPVPPGTQPGFLVALDRLIHQSLAPCLARAAEARRLSGVTYLYRQTLYDLQLRSCERASGRYAAAWGPVIDGRFELRNQATKDVTEFSIAFGTAGEMTGIPVRAVFRPHWWIEIELLVDEAAIGRPRAQTQPDWSPR